MVHGPGNMELRSAKVAEVISDSSANIENYMFAGSTIIPATMDLKEENNVHTMMWLGC